MMAVYFGIFPHQFKHLELVLVDETYISWFVTETRIGDTKEKSYNLQQGNFCRGTFHRLTHTWCGTVDVDQFLMLEGRIKVSLIAKPAFMHHGFFGSANKEAFH